MATTSNTAQTAAQTAAAVNAANRALTLATAERMNQNIGTVNAAIPGIAPYANLNGVPTMRQKLFNVGIITSIDVLVTASINITAIATASPKAPWNLLNYVKIKDFNGVDRVNAQGNQIWALRTIRHRRPSGYPLTVANPYFDNGNVYPDFTKVPTAVANNVTIQFFLRVPLAYDPEGDLSGALLAQNVTAEAYLEVGLNPSVFGADADSVYSAGTGTINNVSMSIWQNYLAPATVGNQIVLPQMDLSTVYELNGSLVTSDNIVTMQEKLLNVPNLRTVLSMMSTYVNGGVMNPGTDVNLIRVLVGGNLPLRSWTPDLLAYQVREHLGFDLPPSHYYVSARVKPIQTAQYGNVQIGITPSAVNAGNTHMDILVESFYPQGAVLQGMQQG